MQQRNVYNKQKPVGYFLGGGGGGGGEGRILRIVDFSREIYNA